MTRAATRPEAHSARSTRAFACEVNLRRSAARIDGLHDTVNRNESTAHAHRTRWAELTDQTRRAGQLIDALEHATAEVSRCVEVIAHLDDVRRESWSELDAAWERSAADSRRREQAQAAHAAMTALRMQQARDRNHLDDLLDQVRTPRTGVSVAPPIASQRVHALTAAPSAPPLALIG